MKVLNTGYNIGSQFNPNFQGDINIAYKKNNSKIRKKTVQGNEDYKIYNYATTNLFNNDLTTKTVDIPTETLKAYTDSIKSLSWLEMPLPNKETTKVELSYNKDDIKTEYTVKTDKFEITHELDNKELEVQEILNRSPKFGPEEYKNLSENDLSILRNYKQKYYREHGEYVDVATTLGSIYSNRLNEQYPEGYTLVCIGRSPALVSKYIEFEGANKGIDVKYIPISGLNAQESQMAPYSKIVPEYNKYLDSIGLTKEFAEKTDKPIIFTDYCFSGRTLDRFRGIMATPLIGIEESDKVLYRPMTDAYGFDEPIFNCNPLDDDYNLLEYDFPSYTFEKYIIHGTEHHKYSSIPGIHVCTFDNDKKKFDEFYKNGNKFEESFDVKMMNFCIAEFVDEQKQRTQK